MSVKGGRGITPPPTHKLKYGEQNTVPLCHWVVWVFVHSENLLVASESTVVDTFQNSMYLKQKLEINLLCHL